MYRSIVVGTDGSDTAAAAVRHAIALAAATGARLHLVTAYTSVPSMSLAAGSMAATPPLDPGSDVWVRELLERFAAEAREQSIYTDVHAIDGPPVQALVDVAHAVGADLLVTGNRGMAGLRGMLGSVPNSLAHRAPCAVLIVPTG